MNLETEYSEKIDCGLNYDDLAEMINLFKEGQLISDRSVFRFLEEIFKCPLYRYKSKRVIKNLYLILNYVNVNFEHPLKRIVFKVIITKLNGDGLPIRRGLKLMNKIKIFKKYYSVLNIIYFSVRRNNNINMVEHLYDAIIREWNIDPRAHSA